MSSSVRSATTSYNCFSLLSSIASNRLFIFLCQSPPDTIADGLRTSVGEITWPIIQEHLDDVFTVTEEEIIYATRLVLERMKIVIEPSSGVVLAAVLTERFKKATAGLKNIAVLLCGGNLDIDKFPPSNK